MRFLSVICACSLLAGLARAGSAEPASAILDVLPSPGLAGGLMAPDTYDALLGDWDVVVTDYDPDGTSHRGTGEWHFGRVLQGRAIQDVFISPRRGERPPSGEAPGPRNRYGSTIRFFDPTIDAWRVTWVNPAQNYVATLVGRSSGREIVQEGEGNGGQPLRWVFSKITPTGFQWRGDVSADGGRTWRRAQEMTARRATERETGSTGATERMMGALVASGPVHGPSQIEDLFGPLVGSWEMTISGRNPDGTSSAGTGEVHFGWILEGRAIQDVWIFPSRGSGLAPAPGDEYGSTLRFYDQASRVWRIVWISPLNHVVRVFQARADGDEIIVEGTNARGQAQRWIFSEMTPTSFRWRNIVETDDGGTWELIERVEAHRTSGAAAPHPWRDMITALAALGPHPSLGDEARVFDRLVGTWDCEYSFHAEDGSVTHSSGELRFGWIIDGRALQDIWISYPKRPNDERSIGTSVRFFDTKARVWRVVFVAPAFGLMTTMEGGAEGDRIVLRGKDSDGSSLRWSFDDIRAGSFTWRGEISRDRGKTWRLEEEHHMKRRTGA